MRVRPGERLAVVRAGVEQCCPEHGPLGHGGDDSDLLRRGVSGAGTVFLGPCRVGPD